MKRQLLTITLFFVLVMPGVVAFAPLRQGNSAVQMTTSVGYGSYYRRGQWIPVRVNVSNSGDDLTGEIRVRSGALGSLEETTYRTPLELPRGGRKQVFLYASLGNFVSEIRVEVVDRKGHVVLRDTVTVHSASSNDLLYAVVTQSPYGAVDLTGLWPGMGSAHQTNWQIGDIPPMAEALQGLDVLMFHDADTGTLTTEQTEAITRWVQDGGHLIVAGGDTWQRTTAGLKDLLPVSLQSTVSLDSVSALVDYLKLSPGTPEAQITAVNSTLKPSAQALVTEGQVPLIVRGPYGAGVVDFLAVDPNSEPLRSWATEKDTLWYTLIASLGQQPSWSRGISDWGIAREATTTTSSTVLPTFFQLCGFLTLYIVLIGPINYLVLKRLNRREWAWLTIPAMILFFSFLAYKVGFNLRGNVPTVNRLSIVHVPADSEQAEITTLIGVQSPRRSTYNIAVDHGYSLRALPEGGIGLNVPVTFTEGTRYVAENIPIDAGMVASFVASGYAAAPHLDATATWHLYDGQPPQITGNVTNTTGIDLQDTVLLIKGEARSLGTLHPGDTKDFDITIGPQDPAPLTLGATQVQYGSYAPNPWQYTAQMPGWCFSYQGLPLTIPDVMRGERFSCSAQTVTSRQQEIRRRYRLLSALVVDRDLSGGRGDGVYLFAWSNQPLVGVELLNHQQAAEDTNLYIFDIPITAQASDPVVEVPPALTTWTMAAKDDPTTMLDATPSSFQVNDNAQAAFQFLPLPGVRLKTIQEIDIRFQAQGPLQVELWNWKQLVWVPVQLSSGTDSTTISNPDQFVGPENAVNVRVLSQDNKSYNHVDYVKIAYRGQLAH